MPRYGLGEDLIARVAAVVYWAIGYLAFVASFLYLVGFVGNRYSFSTVDSGLQIPEREAAVVDLALIALFGLQHSLMARKWWKRLVPDPWQRPTYLLATAAVLAYFYWRWEPIPDLLWRVEHGWWLQALFFVGWALAVWAAFSADHWTTFGLRQVAAYWRGERWVDPPFRIRGPYRWGRHPMMVGLAVAFWSAPEMSRGHALFAAGMTAYIVAGCWFENRDSRQRTDRL
ncbi:MAG: hypothetical protein U0Q16_36765 [Bryobacteraceae bacterium]